MSEWPDINDPSWSDHAADVAERAAQAAAPDKGWPVGTLIVNRKNARRGKVAYSKGNACSVQFIEGIANYWITTWDVVLRNYEKV